MDEVSPDAADDAGVAAGGGEPGLPGGRPELGGVFISDCGEK
jgi:hypothetical protein